MLDKSSSQIQAELNLANQEAEQLRAEIKDLRLAIDSKETRLQALIDRWQGLIPRLEKNLIEARRYEADYGRPRPVFVENIERGKHYVISRVTPKFIWIRRIGWTKEEKFRRETGISSDYCITLDVPATLEAWNDYAENY